MEKVSDWIFVWMSWGEPNLNKIDMLTLLRIMNNRFLAPPADPEILRLLIKSYFLMVLLFQMVQNLVYVIILSH